MKTIRLNNGKEIELNQAFNMDCLELMKQLPDKSVGLIMADPPYFEVKGEFDFVWDSFDDYLKDVEKWAIECKRILADNGSLFWWGHAKKIAYSQVIFDKYFNLGNVGKWEKRECQTKAQDYNQARHFAPVTEHFLFYTNEIEMTGRDLIHSTVGLFLSIKKYMRNERLKAKEKGYTTEKITVEILGLKSNSRLFGHYTDDSQWMLPTKKMYSKLQNTGFYRREYEELRREYEELRRPFNNGHKLNDVILHSQEANITGQYDHDTIKPLGLIKKLLQTTTRKDTLVYIPFWGSGTDSVACHELGLNWLATETSKKHFNNACERYNQETKQILMEF